MQTQYRRRASFAPGLSLVLLVVFLAVLWLAGGASRPDVLGQAVVRPVAALVLATAILFGERGSMAQARPVAWLLAAAIILTMLQLIPLPPGIWATLPGREPLLEAAAASGQVQPWRPWSIVPDATLNATCSLIVPLAILVLAQGLTTRDWQWLPGILLGTISAAMLLGLVQFSGVRVDNPLVNDTPGEVAGIFANRNHFALLLAMGCLIAPVWALSGRRVPGWRAPLALGLQVLFTLVILATGSRAGLVLGGLGLGIGLLLVRRDIRRVLRRYSRWVFPVLAAGVGILMIGMVAISVAAGRAVSVSRLLAIDPGQDMRGRGLPTVLSMVRDYFPVGAGFGTFDPIFRMHEPLALLKLTFFNHAHNDYLEVVLDAGLPGSLLLLAALIWWVWASARAWRSMRVVHSHDSRDEAEARAHVLPMLGSSMLLLAMIASAFDYPLRTPTMMAITVVAALWLAGWAPALPRKGQQL